MQTSISIHPLALSELITSGADVHLLDVRSPAEYEAAHIQGTTLIPLDELDPISFCRERGKNFTPLYLICQSGGRAKKAFEKLERAGVQGAFVLEGGTQGWIDSGLPVVRGGSSVLPLMRQVQIVVGFLSATGALLALTLNANFAFIPLLIGCGLLVAGLTGFCGLAVVLAAMPWNKKNPSRNSSCSPCRE